MSCSLLLMPKKSLRLTKRIKIELQACSVMAVKILHTTLVVLHALLSSHQMKSSSEMLVIQDAFWQLRKAINIKL